jgi:hypothetical protein
MAEWTSLVFAMTAKPSVADPSLLTKTAFARRMGVNEVTVRGWCKRWCADGMPVRADGKVNEAAALRWVETYLDQARRAARTEGTSGGTVSDLRAHKLSAEARLLEMDHRKRAGELVERAAIERAAKARGVSRIDRRAQGSDRGRYPPGEGSYKRGGGHAGGRGPEGCAKVGFFEGAYLRTSKNSSRLQTACNVCKDLARGGAMLAKPEAVRLA